MYFSISSLKKDQLITVVPNDYNEYAASHGNI